MFTTISYEIGGMFLLAALLMVGTLSGVIPASFQPGKSALIIMGVVVIGFGIFHFGPNLSAAWRSTFANAKNMVSPGQPPTAAAQHPAVPAASHAKAAKQPAPHWKTIVVDDSLFAPTKPSPVSANPVPLAAPSPEVPQASVTQPGENSSNDSPPDRGIKRTVKSVGRFLHINRGNKAPKREP
jgi:hypothetical protein